MSDTQAPRASGPAPKKSVALAGVAAGNTGLCTVGRGGCDLHYRGYDILSDSHHVPLKRLQIPGAVMPGGCRTDHRVVRGLYPAR